jgi:hypothetical protein
MRNLSDSSRLLVLASIWFLSTSPLRAREEAFASMYSDAAVFIHAINKERPAQTLKLATTGITTPHHTVAADLIARAFWTTTAN